jgi:hypothetical protein
MNIILQRFLREHHSAIVALLEQGMLAVDGYFAHLPPPVRRQTAAQQLALVAEALDTGYLPRLSIQDGLDRLEAHGVSPAELLAQVAWVYQALGVYVQRELATDVAARDLVLGRMQQVYSSLVPKLTARLLDQQSYRHLPVAAASLGQPMTERGRGAWR